MNTKTSNKEFPTSICLCVHADRMKLIPNAFSLYFIIGHSVFDIGYSIRNLRQQMPKLFLIEPLREEGAFGLQFCTQGVGVDFTEVVGPLFQEKS